MDGHPAGPAAATPLRPPPARALPWAAALCLVTALGLALWVTGAAQPAPVGDPGPAVRWGLPLVTGLGRLAAALVVGALLLCVTVISPTHDGGRAWATLRRWSVLAATGWLLLQATQLLLTLRDVVGGGPLVPPAPLLSAFLQLGVGRTLTAATVLVALVAVGALVARRPGEALTVLVLAAAALLQLAGTGHAGSTVGHGVAVLALWLHVLAACVWVGGLGALALIASRLLPATAAPEDRAEPSALSRAASRYSVLAAWAYAVLTLSGVLSLALRVTSPGDVLTSTWGRLLLLKVVALGVLGLLGAAHRRHTLPRLQDGRPGAFRRLASGEVLLMAAVLGLSSALARTDPPNTGAPADLLVVVLTGYAAPPPPSVLTLLTQVRVEPVSLLVAGSALLVYLLGVRRVRAAGSAWPWPRTAGAVVALLGLAWVTNGGLAVYGSVLLSAHVAAHLLLVGLLPVACALAAPMTLARQTLPPREDGSLGPREWLEAARGSRLTAVLTRPGVASLHVAAALVVLYLTPVLGLVLTSQVAHLVVVLYLGVAGLLLATALLDPRGPGRTGAAQAALLGPYLGVLVLLGLVLLTRADLLEPDFYARLSLPWLTDPLLDQRRAAVVAWALAVLSALVLVLASRRPPARDGGGRAPGRTRSRAGGAGPRD